MTKRIVFTGGSGKAGKHVVPWLLDKGYQVLNVDLKKLDHPGVRTFIADLTDSGQVFNALSVHFDYDGFDKDRLPPPPDAVVHFAAIPAILMQPDNVTFQTNTVSTYNVIEAAMKLGVKKVIIASSETTYGVCFAEGDKDFHHFPLEEDYDVDPQDSYGLSKVVNEETARAFAMRFNRDIYALRIGNVIEPHEYDRFPGFIANPMSRKRNAWSYIDARDLGQIVHLCIEKDGLGFQVFNAVNDSITARDATAPFLEKYCRPRRIAAVWKALKRRSATGRSVRFLGFREEHDWKKYV